MTMMSLMLGASLAVAGCTTDRYGDRRPSRAVTGGAIGAAGGAGVAAVTGGNVVTGAAIGAAAGAVLGIVTEDRNRYEDRAGQRYYYDDRGEYRYDNRRRRQYSRR
ncbi:YMGG-like glycine zipper-containing protein [Polymorphobacter sp.]|uniref:YMGG-like glycine zipper-containing protein n=1 Tax=Polymorphobacter sp. TaxID=1909290 RepID=UPI003F6FAA5C